MINWLAWWAASSSRLLSHSAFSARFRSEMSSTMIEEVARVAVYVPHEAGGAGDPEHFAILPDISSLHRRARSAGQQLLRILFPLRDIVLEGDIHRGALRQFALRISHHLAKRRVDLVKAFVEAHHSHANGSILEDLAEALLARLEGGRPVRDRAHFTNAAQA